MNYCLVQSGYVYPLFYDTLFADLRQVLADEAKSDGAGRGIWERDMSTSGLAVPAQSSLATWGYIIPKLFRRLTDYFREGNPNLGGFNMWLATKHEEPVIDLDNNSNVTHFDNIVEVSEDTIRRTRPLDRIVFISEK
jgi:hypothetical protein